MLQRAWTYFEEKEGSYKQNVIRTHFGTNNSVSWILFNKMQNPYCKNTGTDLSTKRTTEMTNCERSVVLQFNMYGHDLEQVE